MTTSTDIGLKQYLSYDDTQRGVAIKGIWDDGSKEWRKFDIAPNLFVTCPEESEIKSIYGHNLRQVEISSLKHAKDFVNSLKDTEGMDIYGYHKYTSAFVCENFNGEYDESAIQTWYFDIETEVGDGFPEPEDADQRINLISFKNKHQKEYHVFAFSPIHYPDVQDEYCVVWHMFDDETAMLRGLVSWMRDTDIDVLAGWNIENFDVPYIVNRIKNVLGQGSVNALSPVGKVKDRVVHTGWGDSLTYDIIGISLLDMMLLYKKFVFTPRESYRLDFICQEEINSEKLKHHTGIPGHLLYRTHFTDAVKYNIRDVELLDKLDEKINLLGLAYSMAYMAKTNFGEVMGTVRPWMNMIYDYLGEQNIYFPIQSQAKMHRGIEGAWVKHPKIGMSKWVCSFDLSSLYPSIIRALNMSPETIIDDHVDDISVKDMLDGKIKFYDREVCVAANGSMYRKDVRGFIPVMIDSMFGERKKFKGLMMDAKKKFNSGDKSQESIMTRHDTKQMALKIMMNSLYGAIGNRHFHFYDPRIAEGITLSGQLIDQWMGKYLNAAVNKLVDTKGVDYTIAGDTDSIYITAESLVMKKFGNTELTQDKVDWLANFCDTKLNSIIEQGFDELGRRMSMFDRSVIAADREAVAYSAVFLAKKRYLMAVNNLEGIEYPVDKPYIKVMGTDAIRSNTPQLCRQRMKEVYRTILLKDKDAIMDHIDAVSAELFSEDMIEVLAINTGVNNISKYMDVSGGYITGAPMNSKASITYNNMLHKHSMEEQYDVIKEGDKIKVVFLRMPNPTGEPCIAWKNDLPSDLFSTMNLLQYVDMQKQYDRGFKTSMGTVLESMGMNIQYREVLDI